ncbi:hypothetical protein QQ045_019295 [Rhodiola kirilowii]
MGSKQAPSWADQWATGGSYDNPRYDDDDDQKQVDKKNGNKKLDAAKSAASVGMEKAKAGAVMSAQKVKSGTSGGIKWLKNQYSKKMSSSSSK